MALASVFAQFHRVAISFPAPHQRPTNSITVDLRYMNISKVAAAQATAAVACGDELMSLSIISNVLT
jgi:hypothetical protein